MTLDHNSIVEKKAQLQQAIRVLNELKSKSVDELAQDEITQGALLHYLMIAIESILDIGSHILTEDFKAAPESYEQVLILLGQKKVINAELAERSTGMGKFRNKLIHEYAEIDLNKVHQFLQHAPDQFSEFDQAFSAYLKR